MVAGILRAIGVYLGRDSELYPAAEENLDGYWEHIGFVDLNNRILDTLGGSWDSPPAPEPQWCRGTQLIPLRREAQLLIADFPKEAPWGWKDPRNCLTLPFWTDLLPNVGVVVCLRHPLEVAESLHRRGKTSRRLSMKLWAAYNRGIMESCLTEQRLITRYDSFFSQPGRELGRIIEFLRLDVPHEALADAIATVKVQHRHNEVDVETLIHGDDDEVIDLYEAMVSEASVTQVLPIVSKSDPEMLNASSHMDAPAALRGEPDDGYSDLLGQLRRLVCSTVPESASIAVMSRGDDQLVSFPGRVGRHFPSTSDGVYLGYNPVDDLAAVAQLEVSRARGATFLVIPKVALWWLDHYRGFGRYLNTFYQRLPVPLQTAAIYDLTRPIFRSFLLTCEGSVRAYRLQHNREPVVLDWTTDQGLTGAFPHWTIFRPPTPGIERLPYLDSSVDIIAIDEDRPERTREAQRVAEFATLSFPAASQPRWSPEEESASSGPASTSTPTTCPPMPSVSIIVGCTPTGRSCVPLLMVQQFVPRDQEAEIVISSDDCPPKRDTDRLNAAGIGIRTLPNDQGIGFFSWANAAARSSRSELLVFFHSGSLPLRGWLDVITWSFVVHRDAGAVGGKLLAADGQVEDVGGTIFADGSVRAFGYWDDPTATVFDVPRESDLCSRAFLATPRSVFLEVGGFDHDDTRSRPDFANYCLAIRNLGLRTYYEPDAIAVRLDDPAQGPRRPLGSPYQIGNRDIVLKRWERLLNGRATPISAPPTEAEAIAPQVFASESWRGGL